MTHSPTPPPAAAPAASEEPGAGCTTIYRCSCGNAVAADKVPPSPAPIEGSKSPVKFRLEVICGKHQIPTVMRRQS